MPPTVDTEEIQALLFCPLMARADLKNQIRETGRDLSDRNLTYYTTRGLIPPALRIGSGEGQYPEPILKWLCWLLDMRAAGLSIEALVELRPLWVMLISDPVENHKVAESAGHLRHPGAQLALPSLLSRYLDGGEVEIGSTVWAWGPSDNE